MLTRRVGRRSDGPSRWKLGVFLGFPTPQTAAPRPPLHTRTPQPPPHTLDCREVANIRTAQHPKMHAKLVTLWQAATVRSVRLVLVCRRSVGPLQLTPLDPIQGWPNMLALIFINHTRLGS